MSDAARRVAAFDVDGTLTTRDCVVPFLRRVAGAGGLATGVGRRSARVARGVARRDRDALKELAAEAALSGRPLAEVAEVARSFAHEVARRWLRDDAVDRLRRHRADGDLVVMVSASFEVYLDPLGALLGADRVIGTRLAVHPSGTLTGRLDGPNCRGSEKVRRLHEDLATMGLDRAAVRLVAYGDSPGDRELLADADEAHCVGRRR